MASTANELESAPTMPRFSAAVLAEYLRRVQSGTAESPEQLLAAHPGISIELGDFFAVHPMLRAAAEKIPANELHQAATLAGSIASTDRMLAIAQTLDGGLQGAIQPPTAAVGAKTFGDYELLSLIAKGGMGAVYKARQRKLNRIVAVKMILAGQFADQDDINRFYAEAEAAANLRHPNIVAIHEVGVFEGQHFFSMDFIPGKSLSELVRENPLPPKEAAEHVRTIARAMQFAHAQGILHRDLKPSNVLLDKSGEPLITDFGLAKRVSGQSQLTATGAVVGTPSYMPPEQAAAEADQVGPASDVYSIGAILYELLTGRPPFAAATVMLTIRQVLESEPVSPRLLNTHVPRDLETICIKCLQKSPAHRYATAQELVDELTRFLAGEPIRARPIGPAARAWRWCRRNPLVASLAALAAGGFLAALAASTIGYVQTRSALAASEESFRQAREAVDELFTQVSEDTLLNEPGMQPLREKLLRRALEYYERFLAQRGQDPNLRDELAATLFRVGLITETIGQAEDARRSYTRAAEIQRQLVSAHPTTKKPLQDLGITQSALGSLEFKLHERAKARSCFQEAIDAREKLVALDSGDLEAQRLLANSYMNLGLLNREEGDLGEAKRRFSAAQSLREKALQRQEAPKVRRDLGKGHYHLAQLAWQEQDFDEAERQFERAIGAFEKLPAAESGELENQRQLAACYRLFADLQEDSSQALEFYNKARVLLEPLARRNPEVLEFQTDLAGVYLNLGALHQDQQDSAKALEEFQKAHGILEPLVSEHPLVPRYRRDLAMALLKLGEEHGAAGDLAVARKELTESLWHLDRLLAAAEEDEDLRAQRAAVAETLARLDAG